jgi:hypothetical protein
MKIADMGRIAAEVLSAGVIGALEIVSAPIGCSPAQSAKPPATPKETVSSPATSAAPAKPKEQLPTYENWTMPTTPDGIRAYLSESVFCDGRENESIPERTPVEPTESYEVTLRCDPKAALEAGHYDWVETGLAEAFKRVTDCREGAKVRVSLFHFGSSRKMISAHEIYEAMGPNFRPATWVELLALGADYPALQTQKSGVLEHPERAKSVSNPQIMAIGTILRGVAFPVTPFLADEGGQGGRSVNFIQSGCSFDQNWFAAVSK